MILFSFLRFFSKPSQMKRPQPRATFKPRIELLEGRVALSTLRVGAAETYHTIQAAVTAAHSNDTILVDPGTYQEQVTIGAGKNGLELESVKPLAAVIQAPAVLTGDGAIVHDAGAKNIEIDGFTIQGPSAGSSGRLFGILIDHGGSATLTDNHITAIRNDPLSGNQEGIGIQVGNNLENQSGSAVIEHNTIDDYQKGGIVVEHTDSAAEVEGNTVAGVGPTAVIAQNGIQISDGANAEVSGNRVSGNVFTGASDMATGILLFKPGKVVVDHNTVFNNDAGVYALGAKDPVIDHNDISGNTSDGIDLDGTTGARLTFNYVTGNGNDGIALFNTSTNNTIDHNHSTNNGNDGVFVELGSSGNRFTHNILRGNTLFDAEDDTIGSGTAGTANRWDDNDCLTDNKNGGLCQDHHHAHNDESGEDGSDHHGNP